MGEFNGDADNAGVEGRELEVVIILYIMDRQCRFVSAAQNAEVGRSLECVVGFKSVAGSVDDHVVHVAGAVVALHVDDVIGAGQYSIFEMLVVIHRRGYIKLRAVVIIKSGVEVAINVEEEEVHREHPVSRGG